LVLALVASQVLNVYLLMGERQFIARTAHYDSVIERMVEEAQTIPEFTKSDLPLVLLERGSPRGAIFVSEFNRVELQRGGQSLPEFSKKLAEQLSAAGIATISTQAKTAGFSGRQPPPPRRGGPPGAGPRPGGPPPRGGPRMYHPSTPPDHGGRPGPGFEEVVFSAELRPGVWLNALAPHYATESMTSRAVLTTGLTLLGAIIAAMLLARQIGKPIRQLGDAAAALGRGEAIAALPERGPRDIESTTRAFNQMQERLTRVIEEQRATLRAVGHDLRTPLTSLRIRAEAIPEEHGRSKMIAGLEQLSEMTDEILSWSKDASAQEEVVPVDLSALLDSLVQDYQDQSLRVDFNAPETGVILKCRRSGLRRAVRNIVDNALKYGESAEISVEETNEHYCVQIVDDGPGIPEEHFDAVMAPFHRLETSRNRETGGTGLGLSIAQSIMMAHGGRIQFSNVPGRGLRVSLCLPKT
ncbi:MAG: ATP-binding protein, partial [Pseudomonadota bacterium]